MNKMGSNVEQLPVRRGVFPHARFAWMKRIAAALTAVVLVLGSVSCGAQEDSVPEQTTTAVGTTVPQSSITTGTTTPDSGADSVTTTSKTTEGSTTKDTGSTTEQNTTQKQDTTAATKPTVTEKPKTSTSTAKTIKTTKSTKTTTKQTTAATTNAPQEPVVFSYKDNPALMVQRLSSSYRTVYQKIKAGFDAHSTEIAIPDGLIKSEDMSEFIQMLLVIEYGYSFVGDDFSMTVSSGGWVTKLKPNYTMTKAQQTKAENALDKRVAEIVANVSEYADDYERLLYIHDEIVTNCTYQDGSAQAYSAYGCLVEGKAVCQGYATAFFRLCSEMGIECMPIFGKDNSSGGGGTSHMWNKVKLGGSWYNVDITWDDPTFSSEIADYVRYDFFCVTDAIMLKEHTVTDSSFYSYPTSKSTKYDYFDYYGYVVDNISDAESIILKQLKSAAKTGEKYIRLRCSSESAFYAVKQDLFGGGGSAKIFDVLEKGQSQYGGSYSTKTYTNSDSDVYYTITLTLKY